MARCGRSCRRADEDRFAATGARDAAIMLLGLGGGLRRSEIVALDLGDYDPEKGEVKVLHGKGRKERLVPLPPATVDALAVWISLRGSEPGPLFLPLLRGGHVVGRRLTDHALACMLKRRAHDAGVKSFSSHDLRRTFISNLLDLGADISSVQVLAGHASVTTTQRYDRRGHETRREAVGLLKLPKTRREVPVLDSGRDGERAESR